MTETLWWILKIVVVVALLGGAAALATPRGRLPLALRGLRRMLRKDAGETGVDGAVKGETVTSRRKILAFLMVILAALVAAL